MIQYGTRTTLLNAQVGQTTILNLTPDVLSMYFIEREIDLSVCYIHQVVKEGYILMPEVTNRYDKYCTFLSLQESKRIVNLYVVTM